ncbi:MAG: MFS transporter [Geminocystis sp.]|nr:MFS transporter [Geminocystis sp.]MCS7147122.1 MFS transporter [Geminocystis sp.]MDW8116758.1 MFS transporter [Geminocystis sp.]MDW8463487.1 MFS transporter [Geminocystis sp.]
MPSSPYIHLVFLFFSSLFFWIGNTCLLPVLPTYLEDTGLTAKQVGYIMACFAIGLLLSRVWLGKLADEGLKQTISRLSLPSAIGHAVLSLFRCCFGRLVYYPSRKIVIVIGTIVAFTAPLLYLFFVAVPQLVLIRAFHGISIAAFTTGYSALVVDLSPPQKKGELIGYMSLAVPIGMAIGPSVGGFLLDYTSNYQVVFITAALCGLIALGFIILVPEIIYKTETNISEEKPTEVGRSRGFLQLILSPSLLAPTVVLLLVGSIFGTLVTFLPLYIRHLRLDFNAGLFYSSAAIASFVVRFVAGKASDRYGRGVFITLSLLCYIIAMGLLTLGNSGETIMLAAITEGMGAGIIFPISLALVADRCSTSERGKAFAICISGFDLGVALGGPVLGAAVLDFGYRILFATTTAMAMLAFLVFLTFSNKKPRYSWAFAFGLAPDLYAQ